MDIVYGGCNCGMSERMVLEMVLDRGKEEKPVEDSVTDWLIAPDADWFELVAHQEI